MGFPLPVKCACVDQQLTPEPEPREAHLQEGKYDSLKWFVSPSSSQASTSSSRGKPAPPPSTRNNRARLRWTSGSGRKRPTRPNPEAHQADRSPAGSSAGIPPGSSLWRRAAAASGPGRRHDTSGGAPYGTQRRRMKDPRHLLPSRSPAHCPTELPFAPRFRGWR